MIDIGTTPKVRNDRDCQTMISLIEQVPKNAKNVVDFKKS
jgi:hypothetical protein